MATIGGSIITGGTTVQAENGDDRSGFARVAVHPQASLTRAKADVAVVAQWLHAYVTAPHPELGRVGPVCPFVLPSLKVGATWVSLHYGVTGQDPAELSRIMSREIELFPARTPTRQEGSENLDALLVVLPDVGPEGRPGIDVAYPALKAAAVERGLMVGQFHPACDERAVRNRGFRVARAPVALYALRRMAVHDILFLHETDTWFLEYRRRFGHRVAQGKLRDTLSRQIYAQALELYDGSSAPADDRRGW